MTTNLCCLDTVISSGLQFHILTLVLYMCKSRQSDCKTLQPAVMPSEISWKDCHSFNEIFFNLVSILFLHVLIKNITRA